VPFPIAFHAVRRSGDIPQSQGQWHKKTKLASDLAQPAAEQELNCVCAEATSPGLMGEVGIHQVDLVNWFFSQRFRSRSQASAAPCNWKDGRDVPDTIQAVFEYPSGASLSYEATLGNSFEGTLRHVYGVESAILLREGSAGYSRKWMRP